MLHCRITSEGTLCLNRVGSVLELLGCCFLDWMRDIALIESKTLRARVYAQGVKSVLVSNVVLMEIRFFVNGNVIGVAGWVDCIWF